jgi:PKD repeat protein
MLTGCVENPPEETTNKIPEAGFTIDLETGEINIGTTITFTDTSTDEDGTIAEWDWDFGDSTTSTEQNPTHSYESLGTYIVTLIVTDDQGNASEEYTMNIDVTNVPPTAAFSYDPMVNLTVNTTITFTDESTIGDANISLWLWDFGDASNTSSEQNPTHMYTEPGTYTVSLTVTDENELEKATAVTITVS